MPLKPDGGGDVALVRDPTTGLFDLMFDDTNNFAFDDTETHTVLSLLLERQGEYWADQTGKRGSLLHTLRNDLSTTRSQVIAYVNDALAPAVADGRISNVNVMADRLGSGRYAFTVYWRARSGKTGNVRLPLGY
jgi:phage gp46-like protein